MGETDASAPINSVPDTPEVTSCPYDFSLDTSNYQLLPLDGQPLSYLDVVGCKSEDPNEPFQYDTASSQMQYPAMAGTHFPMEVDMMMS